MRITPRERGVIECLAKGMTNKQIGFELDITEGTTKTYVSRLIKKLFGYKGTRYTLVRFAVRDHERLQAIELDKWIRKWEEQIPEEALIEIRSIMARQVADMLR